MKTRNRHGGYLLHQIEQEMKSIETSQILANLQQNLPNDPLKIAGQLVDWLPESMSIVMECKKIEEKDEERVFSNRSNES